MRCGRSLTAAIVAGAVLAATVAAAPGTLAGAATWFLTAEDKPTGLSIVCPNTPRYHLSGSAPNGTDKAYMAHANGLFSCWTVFQRTVDGVVEVDGNASVTLELGCDLPTVYAGGLSPRVEVELVHNHDQGTFATFDLDDQPLSCTPDDPARITGTAEDIQTRMIAGDWWGVKVQAWGINPAPVAPSLHVVTGGEDPARVTIDGWSEL